MTMRRVVYDDNLVVLGELATASIPLIYIDPPFNTGQTQTRLTTEARQSPNGDRTGFQGHRYLTTITGRQAYADKFDDYLAFLEPRLCEAHRVLSANGTLYLHIDYREAHYCKILLDQIFGRASFLNEVIWAYDYGGKAKRRWPAKHDTILVYVKDPQHYVFNADEIDREPYLAPGLVTPEKAARGKRPTDVWWHTIVSPTGSEKIGYPTQKPLGIIRRIIQASPNPSDVVLDFFAGSGTTGVAAAELDRGFLLVDNNETAIATMKRRFVDLPGVEFEDRMLPPALDGAKEGASVRARVEA